MSACSGVLEIDVCSGASGLYFRASVAIPWNLSPAGVSI